MHPAIERVPVSESPRMAEIASDFYSDDPVFEYILGKKNGVLQRRLALKNCIVTSDFCQTVYSDASREAFVHVVEPGSWDSALHEFILRGTMKIPFVIDSGTIERMSEYRDLCKSVMPEGMRHVAAAYCAKGREAEARETLGEASSSVGSCCAMAHTDAQASMFLDSGFSRTGESMFQGVRCVLLVRD